MDAVVAHAALVRLIEATAILRERERGILGVRNKTRRGTELSFYLSDACSKYAEHYLFTRVEPLEYGRPRGGRSCVDDGAR